jgi:hypothetical protein
MSEDVSRILRIYEAAQKRSGKMRAFSDAQDYVLSLGDAVAKALNGIDFSALSEEEIDILLDPVFRRAYSDAVKAGATMVRMETQSENLGLDTLSPQYNAQTVKDLAKEFVEKQVSMDYIRNAISSRILQGFDDTIRKNAQAHDNMGLSVHIVRKYSDLGLRNGTKYAETCQWCKSRCGEWHNYADAVKAGAFERHDGCCCQIEYKVGRTHTMSKDKWNWYNR